MGVDQRHPRTATILFTDLVGSTAQRVALGEEGADELRRDHDQLLHAAVTANNGRVVKGSGDGVMAAFGSASDALTAAVAAQRALDTYSRRPDAVAPLLVRMGLSAGDVAWEDGDYHGIPVVEAARLEAAAAGGEILCSDLVRVLARGRGGHRFDEVGFLELKGLPEPLAVCRVLWEPAAEPAALHLPLPSTLRTLADDPVFVGRAVELAAVDAAIGPQGRAERDDMRIAWLIGEPGAGKTRLAADVAARFHGAGGLVLLGRCDADVPSPYRPFVEILGQLVARLPADDVERLFRPHASELVRLVPRLGSLAEAARVGSPDDPVVGPEIGRWRLLEAIRGLLVDLAVEVPTLLVIDDLHWATDSTLQTIRHLVRSDEPPTLTLLMTVRHTEPGDEVREVLDELAGALVGTEVALAGLDADGVAALAKGVDHPVDERTVSDLLESTAGNPLFLRTLLRPGDDALVRSQDVRSAVRRRLGRLPATVVEVLRVGSVVGLELDCSVVAAVLDRPLGAVVEDLDRARGAGLVTEMPAGAAAGTALRLHRFVHALVRDALLDGLSGTAQALWHLRIAEHLDARPGERAPVTVRAHHWTAALPAGADRAKVAGVLVDAGTEAEQQHDWERAARQLLEAVELLGGLEEVGPRPEGTVGTEVRRLALRGARALHWMGAPVDGTLDLLARAAEASWADGDDDGAALAVIDHSWVRLYTSLPATHAIILTGRVRERPPSGRRERLLIDTYHMVNLAREGHLLEAEQLYGTTVIAARTAGDEVALRRVLAYATHPSLSPVAWAQRYDDTRQAFDLALAHGDLVVAADAASSLGGTALARGAHVEAWPKIRALLERRELLAAPATLYSVRALASALHLARGDLAAAESAANEALELGSGLSGVDAAGIHGVQMFAIRREQGAIPALLPLLRRVLDRTAAWSAGLAALGAAGGDVELCREQLDKLVGSGRLDLPHDVARAATVAFLAEAAVVAGDPRASALLHDELAPESGVFIVMFPSAFGPVDRVLGLASCVAGEVDRGIAQLAAAVDLTVRAETPVYEARCRIDLAERLVARGRPGDRERARAEAGAALEQARRFGMRGVERAALDVLAAGSD